MSDFDKEAEREKLREKYEQDNEKREATERMSELLLQGATMTNAHCSECGDPVFRYDGQEFCATCERAIERETDDGDESGKSDADDDQASAGIEVTSPDENTQVQFGGASAEQGSIDGREKASRQGRPGQQDNSGKTRTPRANEQADSRPAETATDDASRSHDAGVDSSRVPDRSQNREKGTHEPAKAGDADIGEAYESLVRSLVRFSERAEAAEDPRTARDELAAAREAAQALDALRR